MEMTRIQNKIKSLFKKISEPNYVMNNYYVDSLIKKLSDTSDEVIKDLLSLQLIPRELIEALKDTSKHHITVKVFLARLLAIICRSELYGCVLLQNNEDTLLMYYNSMRSKDMDPSLKLAYLEVAKSMLNHRTGIEWLIKKEVWKLIFSLYHKSTTVFVLRSMYKFFAEFAWKLDEYGEEQNLNNVIGCIARTEYDLNMNDLSITIDEEEELCEKYEPILQIILAVVSQTDRMCVENRMAHVLMNEHCIITQLCILLDRIRRDSTILLITKVCFHLTLAKVFQHKPYKPNVVYTQEDFVELVVNYLNVVNCLIQRRSVSLVLDFCGACNSIWRSVCQIVQLVPAPGHDKKMELPNQVLMMYLVPVIVYVKCAPKGKDISNEDIESYVLNFFNLVSEHTAKAAYSLNCLITDLDTSYVTLQSVKKLTCLTDHLNDEQANVAFQALYFALRDYDPVDEFGELKEQKKRYIDTEERLLIMTYIVEIALSIVKKYNINWHESMEVIHLNSVIHNILMKRTDLSFKFAVAALNLLTVSVSKFLLPNLSLLMETRPGSALHEIGTLILTKMHDVHWEVRDSALELLCVCTKISYIKFPPLQKQIIDKNLINEAVTIALNDKEAYVQVSALRCVSASSRVAAMCDQVKAEHPDLAARLIGLLRHNYEGIVRKEACNVLCELYQSGKPSAALKQALYEHMASSAMCDFHWEVQITTLKFWKIVIQVFLMDQGMLDGTFPPVTFSRESRKIVTLNEAEIRKRLIKVLDDLASIGCLTVLLKLMDDDNTELEVLEAAYSVALELYKILQKYKVSDYVQYVEGEAKSVAELLYHIKEKSDDELCSEANMETETSTPADVVIGSIAKSDDMSLLADIYQRGMNLKSEEATAPKLRLIRTPSPYLFVKFMESTDCKTTINQKKEWQEGRRSITSLVDDLLDYRTDNTNEDSFLDCY